MKSPDDEQPEIPVGLRVVGMMDRDALFAGRVEPERAGAEFGRGRLRIADLGRGPGVKVSALLRQPISSTIIRCNGDSAWMTSRSGAPK
jgi:hypothetical protein